jgi:hypothetical protein
MKPELESSSSRQIILIEWRNDKLERKETFSTESNSVSTETKQAQSLLGLQPAFSRLGLRSGEDHERNVT